MQNYYPSNIPITKADIYRYTIIGILALLAIWALYWVYNHTIADPDLKTTKKGFTDKGNSNTDLQDSGVVLPPIQSIDAVSTVQEAYNQITKPEAWFCFGETDRVALLNEILRMNKADLEEFAFQYNQISSLWNDLSNLQCDDSIEVGEKIITKMNNYGIA